MKTNEKKIDAVKMMREIRDKLHLKYAEHPELRQIELEKIRKEYNFSKSHSVVEEC